MGSIYGYFSFSMPLRLKNAAFSFSFLLDCYIIAPIPKPLQLSKKGQRLSNASSIYVKRFLVKKPIKKTKKKPLYQHSRNQ